MSYDFLNTTIQPREPFSEQQTRSAVSQGIAGINRSASLPGLLKNSYRPTSGFGVGPATYGQVAPQLAAGAAGVRDMRNTVPLADAMANQRSKLSGQVAREGEAFGLAELMRGERNTTNQNNMQNNSQLMSLLQAMLMGQ
jgi:hypothetical protein